LLREKGRRDDERSFEAPGGEERVCFGNAREKKRQREKGVRGPVDFCHRLARARRSVHLSQTEKKKGRGAAQKSEKGKTAQKAFKNPTIKKHDSHSQQERRRKAKTEGEEKEGARETSLVEAEEEPGAF